MKKTFIIAIMAILAIGAQAQEKKTENKNKPVFTVVKENPITSIKDQNRSGTCWAYSTLSYFEAEILKKTGKTYDLCESFVANKDYMDRAIQVVRLHGDCQFAQGGSAYDVHYVLQNYGICPEEAMPFPGSLYGDSLNNLNEFFSLLEPYVAAVSKSNAKKISNQWKVGLQGILDAYLGKCPEEFTYQGKKYTPKSFAASLGLDWNDYVSITSFTHHPFYTAYAVEVRAQNHPVAIVDSVFDALFHPFYQPFVVEVQDNWRWAQSYNLPLNEMMEVIDNAINNGYTIAWGADVSEKGFGAVTRVPLNDKEKDLSHSDAARWTGTDGKADKNVVSAQGEKTITQEMRQKAYDNWETTDDHGMVIYGIAKDSTGAQYYMVKNSWGEYGPYKGMFYASKPYVAYKTMNFVVNKAALPKEIAKKLGIKL